MLVARAFISFVHDVTSAAHVASRVWVMRVTDLEAWKKELDDY